MKGFLLSSVWLVVGFLLSLLYAQESLVTSSPQVMPRFQAGVSLSEWLQAHVNYPAEALERNEHGRVVVEFVVEKDGNLSSFKVLKSVSPLLDAEALRVAQTMPPFIPGYNNGRPCRVKYSLPVSFRLEDDAAQPISGVHESKSFLINGSSVANISVGMLVSQIPEKLEGLYDTTRQSRCDASFSTLTLYDAGMPVLEVNSVEEDVVTGKVSEIRVYTPKVCFANGMHVGMNVSELATIYGISRWMVQSDGKCAAYMQDETENICYTLYTTDVSDGRVECISVGRKND